MPRFVTALVYLNRAWKDEWRGATRLRVAPRKRPKKARSGRRYVDVAPKPGRLLLMDQDITHSVTRPHAAAGERPRYSLVLKLVLHPPASGESAARVQLADPAWGEPAAFGSAALPTS